MVYNDAAIRYLNAYFQQNPGEDGRLERENRGQEISNEEFLRQFERLILPKLMKDQSTYLTIIIDIIIITLDIYSIA